MAKILIIGGGVAGLSAGIHAQIYGHSATICERHFTAGGNLTGWQRGDYHIDNCIHWLTGTNPATDTYEMWRDLGVFDNVQIYQGEDLYTYEREGKRLSLNKDLQAVKQQMLAISPKDETEILSFVNAVKTVMGLMGIGGKNFDKKSNIFAKIIRFPQLVKYYNISTGELAERFYHPTIRGFLTSLMGEDFSSIALLIVFATYCGKNGGIPQGGSCGMASRMVEKFKSLGGELLLNKQALNIKGEKGWAKTVTFTDGSELSADYVVITTDPEIAFYKLLESPMPKYFKKQYNNPAMQRFSGYHCAFSCDTFSLPFKGDIIFDVSAIYRAQLHTKQLIVREFSHEKTFAPQGKTVLQTLTFCEEKDALNFIKLRENLALYESTKNKIANSVLNIICQKFPSLYGKIKCIDVWTPATYNRYTGSSTGSFMSFLLPPKVIPKVLPNAVKKYKNVLLATQWLQAPGGLPIAAKVGKTAIDDIIKKENALNRVINFSRKPKTNPAIS